MKDRDYKYISLAPYEVCKDASHLEQFFQDVIDKGGEGIILRDPSSPFESGRSNSYLKHKKYRDAEAKIVKKVSPVRWECELPNGVHFTAPAGTIEFTRRHDPQPGDIVSFKHRGFLFASKKPKLPTLYRLRTDLSWTDVLRNWKEKTVVPSAAPLKKKKRKRKIKGYWADSQNRKKFLLAFADKMGFDPMVAGNWKRQRQNLVKAEGTGLLNYYGGSLKLLLKATFPQLRSKVTQDEWPREARKANGYWQDLQNRQTFLLSFARKMGFDPMVPHNWISQRKNLLANGGSSLLKLYGKFSYLLADTFPELNIKEEDLKVSDTKRHPQKYWADRDHRKEFLETFAIRMGFDPMVTANWKKYRRHLLAYGGSGLLQRYSGLESLLADTFPELREQATA